MKAVALLHGSLTFEKSGNIFSLWAQIIWPRLIAAILEKSRKPVALIR
jgi:hypothetical protein